MVKDHRDETEHSLLPLHRYSPISYKESIIYMHHPTERITHTMIFVTPVVEEGKKEMFYLMTHSTHFIYSYVASHIR